jgi:hypothetical protein
MSYDSDIPKSDGVSSQFFQAQVELAQKFNGG